MPLLLLLCSLKQSEPQIALEGVVTVALENLNPLLHKNSSMLDVPVEEQLESKLNLTVVVGFRLTAGQRSVQNGSDVALLYSARERSSFCDTHLTRCLPALLPVEGPDPVHKMVLNTVVYSGSNTTYIGNQY